MLDVINDETLDQTEDEFKKNVSDKHLEYIKNAKTAQADDEIIESNF